jgi:hypothetical protein
VESRVGLIALLVLQIPFDLAFLISEISRAALVLKNDDRGVGFNSLESSLQGEQLKALNVEHQEIASF